jgi:thiol-disulfide isomerase/thioredoxin
MTMKMKWAVATVASLALSFLTLSADLEWPPFALGAGFGGAGHVHASEAFSCPADAKAANLKFTLKDLDGKDVSLATLKNKVILLDFWATWCGPCKIEIPWFVEFQNKYGAQGLQVVGVVMEDDFTKVKPFAEQFKMNYLVLDGSGRTDIEDAYGPLIGMPTTFLIGREGQICSKHAGLQSKDKFESEIAALLAAKRAP